MKSLWLPSSPGQQALHRRHTGISYTHEPMSCFRGGHAEHVLCYRPHAAPPFLSLFFYLDRQIMSDLVMEMEPEERPYFMEGQGVSVADAEPEFMETMLRLAELPGKPNQIPIRTPIIMRELHHLLLIDPQGGALQGLYTRGSRNNQNERAASAALSAGYESVTQFNREYKRMFGEPPHRDISRRRYMA